MLRICPTTLIEPMIGSAKAILPATHLSYLCSPLGIGYFLGRLCENSRNDY
jgi:hypothetical protein